MSQNSVSNPDPTKLHTEKGARRESDDITVMVPEIEQLGLSRPGIYNL